MSFVERLIILCPYLGESTMYMGGLHDPLHDFNTTHTHTYTHKIYTIETHVHIYAYLPSDCMRLIIYVQVATGVQ